MPSASRTAGSAAGLAFTRGVARALVITANHHPQAFLRVACRRPGRRGRVRYPDRLADDPYNLQRFVEAQQRFAEAEVPAYMAALAELRDGRKRGHWIWYVLPQLRGLGASTNASLYGIGSLAEARAYLAHPSLGPRLRECVAAICRHRNRDAEQILGGDACKFRSCLTL